MKALKSKVLHCTLYIIPVHVSEEAIIDWYVFIHPLLSVRVLPVDEVMLQAGVVGLGARQRGGLHLHHTQPAVVVQHLPTPLLQSSYVAIVIRALLSRLPPKYFYVLETLCVCYNSKH